MKNIFGILLIACLFSCNAQINQLITTTQYGGASGNGAIYSTDTNGNNFHLVYSFEAATGRLPLGRLTMDTAAWVYGVTEFGGTSDSCTIFKYNPQTATYTLLHDFGATENLGWWDQTGPIPLPDGNLYGMGQDGGLYGGGAIYRVNPVTLAYQDLYDFNTTGSSGETPVGGLFYTGGKLYGMTEEGGSAGQGVLFSFDPVTRSFTPLHQFSSPTGDHPGTGALMLANDNKLYGATDDGGDYGAGGLFSYDLATNTYRCIHLFDAFDGAYPNNALVQATNGKLYGLASQGGIHSAGTLFSFDIQTDSFSLLYSFDVTHGGKPLSSLTQAADGLLYGTASAGGTYNEGVIFSYNINSNTYSVVHEFDSLGGTGPNGTVLDYGMHGGQFAVPGFAVSQAKVCVGSTVSFENMSTGGTSYQWFFPGGVPSNSSAQTPQITYDTTGAWPVMLIARNEFGQDTFNQVSYITVFNNPDIIISTLNSAICLGDSATLTVTGATTYQWTPVGGLSSDSISNPVAAPRTTTVYYATGVDTNLCSNTDSFTLVVNQPRVSSISPDITVCAGDSVKLDAGIGFSNYSWSTGETSEAITVSTSGNYHLTTTDSNGCAHSDTILIQSTVCLGFSKLNNQSYITLYPNPARDYTFVSVSDNLIGCWLQLDDAVGRVVSRQQINSSKYHLQTGGLAKDVYILKVVDHNGSETAKKLVIK